MSKRRIGRVALSAAAIALAGLGLGAGAYAAASQDVTTAVGGPYHVCVDEHTHDVTKIWGHSAHAFCPQGQLLFKWNVTGPQGVRGPRGLQGPAGVNAPTWRSEVDNGAEFSLTTGPVADTSASGATYSDAGVVVDVGSTDNLSTASFDYSADIATLGVNVWIGDGPEPSTPGVYQLGEVDFCYGLGQFDGGGALTGFFMNSGCGDHSGETLTVSEVTTDYPGLEAYAWVGVTRSDVGAASATVNTVDGQTVNATASIVVDGDTMVSSVTPQP